MSSSIQFSLLIPSYNRPEMIRETVESLLANAGPDVEIIISDDASPKSAEIAAVLADLTAAGRLQLVIQPRNLGWSDNRNALVEIARGEWLILLGDDDRLKPGALDALRGWFQRAPGGDLYGFGYDVIDEDGQRVFTYGCTRLMRYRLDNGSPWPELFHYDAVPMWSHHPFTMAVHRRVFAALRYTPAAGIGDDVLLLWQALAGGFTFTVLPEVLFDWRNTFRSGAYSNLSSQAHRLKQTRGALLHELLRDPALPAAIGGLVRSPTFLQRFLLADARAVAEVQDRLSSGELDAARTRASEIALTRTIGVGDKLGRHWRALVAMGPGHLRRLCFYCCDRYRHDQHIKQLSRGQDPGA